MHELAEAPGAHSGQPPRRVNARGHGTPTLVIGNTQIPNGTPRSMKEIVDSLLRPRLRPWRREHGHGEEVIARGERLGAYDYARRRFAASSIRSFGNGTASAVPSSFGAAGDSASPKATSARVAITLASGSGTPSSRT